MNTKLSKVDNKIPVVRCLIRNAEISNIAKKCFTTSDCNKFTSEILDTKTKEKGLVNKSNFSNLVKNSDLNTNFAVLATQAELKAEQDKTVKLQAFNSNYFCDISHFEDDGTQNYLVFQAVSKYFKTIANTNKVIA